MKRDDFPWRQAEHEPMPDLVQRVEDTLNGIVTTIVVGQEERARIGSILDLLHDVEEQIITRTAIDHRSKPVKDTRPFRRLTARERDTAINAAFALFFLRNTRRALRPRSNARDAAYWALLAGLYAGEAVGLDTMLSHIRTNTRRAGVLRGKTTTAKACQVDSEIEKYRREWEDSEAVQEHYRSAAAYISARMELHPHTVRRHLKRLTNSQHGQ